MNEKYRLLLGVIYTLGTGAILNFSKEHTGLSSILYLLITIIINATYFEKPQFGKRTSWLLLFGLASGAIYYISEYRVAQITTHVNYNGHSGVTTAYSIIISAAITPLFEEKTVRSLIFTGLCKYVHPAISVIAVSGIFAFMHVNSPYFAFLASVVLCIMTIFRVDVFNRAILHGAHNFALILLILVCSSS